jgi:hypothetical protein
LGAGIRGPIAGGKIDIARECCLQFRWICIIPENSFHFLVTLLSKGSFMPASKALFILLVVGVLATGGAWFFVPTLRPGWVDGWFKKAAGYTPAQSPEQAIEKFRELVKKRDYDTAMMYCGGDYLEQLKIGGAAATTLGKAIDNLRYTFIETKKLKSDKVEFALLMLDPFPPEFKVLDLKKQGDDKAYAALEFTYGRPLEPGSMTDWRIDPNMYMTLVPVAPKVLIDLKKEGTGNEAAWRIYFPVPGPLRQRVTTLKDYHGNFTQALNKLNTELKNNPDTVNDIERKLKVELEEAKKQ